MNISFREFNDLDIPSCMHIVSENYPAYKVFQRSVPPALWDIFKGSEEKCIVVLLNDIIVGFGCYLKLPEQCTSGYNVYALSWINIIPEQQKNGIGRLLILELEKYISKENIISFYVSLQTIIPEFYKKIGYHTFHTQDGIYFMRKYFKY